MLYESDEKRVCCRQLWGHSYSWPGIGVRSRHASNGSHAIGQFFGFACGEVQDQWRPLSDEQTSFATAVEGPTAQVQGRTCGAGCVEATQCAIELGLGR